MPARPVRRSLLDQLRQRAARLIAPKPAATTTQSAVFRGASINRLNANRTPSNLSPNQELRCDGAFLRARARQLVRDNAYAAGFVEDTVSQVLGPAGIRLQPRTRGVNGALAKDVNQAIAESFAAWGECESASLDGHDGWIDLQELALKDVDRRRGACSRGRSTTPTTRTASRCRRSTPTRWTTRYNREPDVNGVVHPHGVEFDGRGRPLAYHVWDRHPSLSRPDADADRLPRRSSTSSRDTRPGQVRGVTWFAPVISSAMQFDELTESELMTARVAAGSMGVIVNKSPDAIAAFDEERASRLAAQATGTAGDGAASELQSFEVEPGTLQELMPGQEIQSFAPAHPSPQYAGFAKVDPPRPGARPPRLELQQPDGRPRRRELLVAPVGHAPRARRRSDHPAPARGPLRPPRRARVAPDGAPDGRARPARRE
jgi:lambda family phage portal protein